MQAFGAIGLVLVWFTLRKPPPTVKGDLPWKQKLRQLDLLGATLLLGATSCLNLALQWGGISYPWSDSKVFGCLIGFGLLLITFLYLQFRGKEKLVPPLPFSVSTIIEISYSVYLLILSKLEYPSPHLPKSYLFGIMRLYDARSSGRSSAIVLLANILPVSQGH